MTAQTTDDRTPDSIRDAFEAMIAFLTILIGGPMPRAWPEIAAVAARAIGSQARTTGEADRAVAALASFRDLIQRAAEEHNRRASAAAADMPAERIREMRERCDKATPGPWAVRDEGREGIGIDQAGINNIGSDRFILNEGANGTRADLDFAAHAREDLPAAIAWGERMQAERDTHERVAATWRMTADKYCDTIAERDAEIERLKAELAARAPADASLEARAALRSLFVKLVHVDHMARHLCENSAIDHAVDPANPTAAVDPDDLAALEEALSAVDPDEGHDEQTRARMMAVFDAVDASRPVAPEVDAEDLWSDYRTGRGTVFASDRKAFLAGVAAGRRTREPDMGAPADASRPGLTEEQADAIALGCLQVREDLQRHAIKRAILRASRGETFEVRHPDGTRDRVEPPDPRATLHDGNPESPFAPGSLAAGSATEDRILDRKRGGK